MRTPQARRPTLPPWSKADCPACGDPIEYVTLDVTPADTGQRVAVERREAWRTGTIAARVINGVLHGYVITGFRPVLPGFIPLVLHDQVCEEATPPTEQQKLF